MPKVQDFAGAVGEKMNQDVGFLIGIGQVVLQTQGGVALEYVACAKGAVLKSH